ncbi:hypothetical protein [Mangrovimonas sp. TPBH4]|uniref:hypothetical protein n=1 Tax=Mangrovimonas sp. TPBH4 TaxID=1645914 RepID=UPI0012FA6FB9|nr:hypothetical protein [Mangrovimonas sp. TPBH4]
MLVLFLSGMGVFLFADGHADAFYLKLTSPRQQSLIIGSSRAAQGIQPDMFNARLPRLKLYNYAFSRVHTPYGAPYLESIKNKLDTDTRNGLFILEVNPWTLSDSKEEVGDGDYFKEIESFLGKVHNVTVTPNIPYLLSCYPERNVELLSKKWMREKSPQIFVHSDGWCEVRFNKGNEKRGERDKITLKRYEAISEESIGISKRRLDCLKESIKFLKKHGLVVLVRMPVAETMYDLEQDCFPEFDGVIFKMAEEAEVRYFDGSSQRSCYQYTDGHHLDVVSGRRFTEFLVDYIKPLL